MGFSFLLILMSLALLPVPGLAQAPPERLVVPGERIGAWTLQMTGDNLVAVLGRQTRIASGGQLGSLGLEVFFSGAARVQGLGIFRPGSISSVWKP